MTTHTRSHTHGSAAPAQGRILAADLPTYADRPGTPVTISGWLHRRRRLAHLTFVIVRDRTGLVQVVTKDQQTGDQQTRDQVEQIPEETPVRIRAVTSTNPQAPGGVELIEPTIETLSDPADTASIELWRPTLNTTLPTLLDHAQLTWRHPKRQAVWQIAAASMRGFRSTLDEAGFTEVQSPKLVESATESGANVFEVDYFGRPAYLAQSPQFYKQVLVGVFERVYEVGPVFRAEPHDTVRHLAEYVSLDVELGFIHDHRDVIAVLRDVVAGMVSAVQRHAAGAVQALDVTLPTVPDELPLVHFRDALRIVGAPDDEPDLAPAHERALGRWAREHHGSDFVVVEGYPTAHRAFYSHPEPADPHWSRSFDLIFRGTELVSGAQRLHRYADYLAALHERGLDPAAYAGYLDAFRHGIPPHGGFAIGLERWTSHLVGADNIRAVTLFPRDLHRLSP